MPDANNRAFVVMANDFPDCVFDVEWKADVYCEMQKAWQKQKLGPHMSPRIYYRVYDFLLNHPGQPSQRTNQHYNMEDPTQREREEFIASLRAAWDERQRAIEASA